MKTFFARIFGSNAPLRSTLETEKYPGPPIEDPSALQVAKAITALTESSRPADAFVLLSHGLIDGGIMQTIHTQEGFHVEYREGETFYRAYPLSLAEALAVFEQFRNADRQWTTAVAWKEFDLDDPERFVCEASGHGSSKNQGVVYMLAAGPYYKIGKSISSDRRFKEIQLQLPYPVELIHEIKTDDITGIESYWHQRFKEKRTNGEWFLLTEEDVSMFRSRSMM